MILDFVFLLYAVQKGHVGDGSSIIRLLGVNNGAIPSVTRIRTKVWVLESMGYTVAN